MNLLFLEQRDDSFSLALSLITELDSVSDNSDGMNAHLELHYERDRLEQNLQDRSAFGDFVTGSGYGGHFWDELDGSP